ncbi:hypothetical protein DMA11_02520 [Marinilabiliaceae bacterium JC017]|nr:hypothetical protein DMA11_02520 [Marinilabiliaceae bacterium JC017]
MQKKSIVFLLPVSYYRKEKIRNFQNIFEFLLPFFLRDGYRVILCSLNNTDRDKIRNHVYFKQKGLDHQVKLVFLKRWFPRGVPFYQVLEFILNNVRIGFIFIHYRPKVVYAYNHVGAFLASTAGFLGRAKIVFDMRGDRVDELKKEGRPLWQVKVFEYIQRFIFRRSALVASVSDQFSDLPEKISYLPKYNYYDANVFNYSKSDARAFRKWFKLEDKLVFVYSGTDRSYQMVPEMVTFFSRFYSKYPNSFFMINTTSVPDKFLAEIERHQIPESAWMINRLNQKELCQVQMAGDVALMLRDDLPLNHHSFPTKFTEYIGSGLPVICTPHVHTLAPVVEANGLGMVIDLYRYPDVLLTEIYEKFYQNDELKAYCAGFAFKEYAWQSKGNVVYDQMMSAMGLSVK